jgi:hypothetical protein
MGYPFVASVGYFLFSMARGLLQEHDGAWAIVPLLPQLLRETYNS